MPSHHTRLQFLLFRFLGLPEGARFRPLNGGRRRESDRANLARFFQGHLGILCEPRPWNGAQTLGRDVLSGLFALRSPVRSVAARAWSNSSVALSAGSMLWRSIGSAAFANATARSSRR
jgi:hypothetical protein